jgi:hypothetical protein
MKMWQVLFVAIRDLDTMAVSARARSKRPRILTRGLAMDVQILNRAIALR